MRQLSTFCLLLLPMLVTGGCSQSEAPPIVTDYALTALTPRVYILHGPNELPSKSNQGFMNNPGFVLTKAGVVVVDPGSSLQVGNLVLKKIATVTTEPVIAVFNTHLHGDHWLGNDAIRRVYPKAVIYAHPKMLQKAEAAGPEWIALMNRLTEGGAKGTRPTIPNLGIENDETLALGGMHFRVYHNGVAHTDGDLMIEVVEEKVLFLGDNVFAGRAGRLDDGNFLGNIAACELALKSTALHFVPGHGRSSGREVVSKYRDFLKALYVSVKKYYDQGIAAYEMKDKVVAELKPYQHWVGFDREIGKLISLAYLQVEQQAF